MTLHLSVSPMLGSVVSWLDRHDGAVTALATVLLFVVTVIYVVLTARLVRHEDREARRPHLNYEFDPPGSTSGDLRVENVGTATASNVLIALGPGTVPAGMVHLDSARVYVLQAARSAVWRFRPTNGGFTPGRVYPLTLLWMDQPQDHLWCAIFTLRISDDGKPVIGAGRVEDFTQTKLRYLGLRSARGREKLKLLTSRDLGITELLLTQEVRDGLKIRLERGAQQANALHDSYMALGDEGLFS